MKHGFDQDATQWRMACEALLRERYAMTGLDLEDYRRLEAQVAQILPRSRPSQDGDSSSEDRIRSFTSVGTRPTVSG